MTIDWTMPIEWQDGTAAQIDKSWDSPGTYLVQLSREPKFWDHSYLPKVKGVTTVLVKANGEPERHVPEPRPFIRNVEMPIILFGDGTKPVTYEITNEGSVLRLRHVEDGELCYSRYAWPTLKPMSSTDRKIREVTRAEIVKAEVAAVEQEALEENPMWGSF